MSSFTGNPFMPFESGGSRDTSGDAAKEDRLAADAKRKDDAKALALQNEQADKEALQKKVKNKNVLSQDDDSATTPTSLLG